MQNGSPTSLKQTTIIAQPDFPAQYWCGGLPIFNWLRFSEEGTEGTGYVAWRCVGSTSGKRGLVLKKPKATWVISTFPKQL